MSLLNRRCDAVRRAAVEAGALALVALSLGLCAEARAGGGPENVIVVVNADSWASMTVANEFIHLRKIPPSNVIYLDKLESFETISVADLRDKIAKPVLKAIFNRQLAAQIDYVTYSSDVPYEVNFAGDWKGEKPAGYVGTSGSITGLTYLSPLVLEEDPKKYTNLGSNHYAGPGPRRAPSGPAPERLRLSQDEMAKLHQAQQLYQGKKYAEAGKLFGELAAAHPKTSTLLYNLACCEAREGEQDKALAALAAAVEAGWWHWQHAAGDDDFQALRDRKEFQALLARMKAEAPEPTVAPTQAFRSSYGWTETGQKAEAGEGTQYVLSTMLAVTSGRGNSVREALACLNRSVSADGTHPKGTIYYTLNSDVRTRTRSRNGAFEAAARMLNELGVRAEVVQGTLPKDKSDVMGLMIGTAGFNWKSCRSTILPGAICEHLTSWGGVLREGASQTPLTEFLRHGAAGSSGTVAEPMSIQAKFPLPFMHVHYARGCSLAEAFYQSVQGPYQLLIVGDPLCQPWAKIPRVSVTGVRPGETVKGQITLTPAAKTEKGVSVARYELFVDGVRQSESPPGEPFELDTTALADGYHELRVVAVCGGPIETQGRAVLPITVANKGLALAVSRPQSPVVAWDTPLRLTARMAGAAEILFLHNTRLVGRIAGAKGTVEIDPRLLGQRPVRIRPIAVIQGKEEGDETRIAAAPIDLDVRPARLVRPRRKIDPGRLAKSVQVILQSGQKITFGKPADNWLKQAGVAADEGFMVSGYFSVPMDDVYQFQVRSPEKLTFDVDGQGLDVSPGRRWNFLPIPLATGWHHLRIRGKAGKSPDLDVRFGGPGAYSIAARFHHVPSGEEKIVGQVKPKPKGK